MLLLAFWKKKKNDAWGGVFRNSEGKVIMSAWG
jgi:hypothetical protein